MAVETCRICLGSAMFFHFSRRTCYYLHHLGTSRCCAPISLVRITKIQSRVNNRYKNDKLNFKLFFFSVLKCETRIEHQNTIFKCGLDSLHTWWVFYWDIFCTKPKIIQLKSIRYKHIKKNNNVHKIVEYNRIICGSLWWLVDGH